MKKGCRDTLVAVFVATGIIVGFGIYIFNDLQNRMKKSSVRTIVRKIEDESSAIKKAFAARNLKDLNFMNYLEVFSIESIEVDKNGRYSTIFYGKNKVFIDDAVKRRLTLTVNDKDVKLGGKLSLFKPDIQVPDTIIDYDFYKKHGEIIPFIEDIDVENSKYFARTDLWNWLRLFWFADKDKNITCTILSIDESADAELLVKDGIKIKRKIESEP